MKKVTVTKLKRISLLCFLIFLLCAVINIIVGIIEVCNSVVTSFPWYYPIFIVGTYYIIPLLIFAMIYIILRNKERKI